MSLGEVRLNDDPINRMIALFSKRDKEIDSVFLELEDRKDLYSTDVQENLKITLGMEHLLMKLRIIIVSDTSRVKNMLNQSNLTTPQQTLLKKRLDYLNIVDVRLNELREDFNSIQKMAYTVKNLSL